jgi:hypothetical protein
MTFIAEVYNTIYKYDIKNEDWILQEVELQVARQYASSMMVNASLFPSCDQ